MVSFKKIWNLYCELLKTFKRKYMNPNMGFFVLKGLSAF